MNSPLVAPSLRSRLLKSLLLPIILGILLVGGASCYSTYHEAAEIYDAEQVHFARVLHTLAGQLKKGEVIAIDSIPRHDSYEKYITFRIWKDGVLFLKSDNARDFGPITQSVGFTDRMIGQRHWRFYVEKRGDVTVEVAEEGEVRLDLVRHIIAGIFLPQLIIVPIIAIIIWFGISRGLGPVEHLSQIVRKRNVNQFEPILEYPVPEELRPMVDAINDLMTRIENAMRVEKSFTNYAAHEMRTPIAALKTQAQVILRTKEPERQKELAGELLETVSRTQRIIEQLLTYARVQNDVVDLASFNLAALVMEELRYAAPRATEKRMTIVPNVETLTVVGHVELMRLILSNLLDNAIKYGKIGGQIDISLLQESGRAVLRVCDNGPGIMPGDLTHIFDPFFRISGTQVSGAGLGLAIVKWACYVQHITIQPTAGINSKGFGLELIFPENIT